MKFKNNKKNSLLIALFLTLSNFTYATDGPFKPNVQSLTKGYQVPEWFRDAKFGIYSHWGPVTYALQFKDPLNKGQLGWYGKNMYTPGTSTYKYHEKYWGGPKKTKYTDLIKQFKGKNFNAEEWLDIYDKAGAKFVGTVSIHHDNFPMFDSDITPFCVSKMGPKIDISGELAKAARKRGIKVIGTFHHGFTYRYYQNAWTYDKSAPELYGPKRYPIPKFVKDSNGGKILNPKWKTIPRKWQERWKNLVLEFVDKYQPDLIEFDFGMGWMDKDIRLDVYSEFYNKAIAYGQPQPTIGCKERQGDHLKFGLYQLERGQMPLLASFPWLSETSASSWFYYPGAKVQSENNLVDMYVDIVSKNGCMLLNVGPDYTGKIPQEFRRGLKALGDFNKTCGEGIYSSRPWKTYGEGVTRTSSGHMGAATSVLQEHSDFTSEDIRYTQSKDGKILFAFAMDWPKDKKLTLKSVHVDKTTSKSKIELFGYGTVKYKINKDKTITISIPSKGPNPYCNGFKISGFTCNWQPLGHYLLPNSFRADVTKAKNEGKGKTTLNLKCANIKKASILLGSKKKAKGTIQIFKGQKSLVKVNYAINAGEKKEFGDFKLKILKNVKQPAIDLRIIITGLDNTQLTDFAIGLQRDHTILKLGDSLN